LNYLISCDQNRLTDEARTIFPILEKLAVPSNSQALELAWLKCAAVFHTSFGTPADAIVIARKLLARATTLRSDVAADLQRKAAVAFWRAGLSSEGAAALELAFTSAQTVGLRRLQLSFATMLAGMHLDIGNLARSTFWFEIAEQLTAKGDIYGKEFFHLTLITDMALAARDRNGIVDGARRAEKIADENSSLRTRRWKRALMIAARHFSGEDLDPEIVIQELTQNQVVDQEVSETGDFEIAVALRVLIDAGLISMADVVLRRYLDDYRRTRAPISKSLSQAVSELAAPRRTGS
jgi:hypothetical protein